MKLYFAPVQGHTDAAYRYFHARHYRLNKEFCNNESLSENVASKSLSEIIYTTPFIRIEKGELRKKDSKDVSSELNRSIGLVPQIIFRNESELNSLVDLLYKEGHRRIDLNMGCPFPLQTSKGRGAATIANRDCHFAVEKIVNKYSDILFSVKMRLGFSKEEYIPLLETLNNLNLDYVAIHPRTAKDQYTAPLHIEAFEHIYQISKNSIVYNGEIKTPDDAFRLIEKYEDLGGLMIGRGALARPSIFNEISEGKAWTAELRKQEMMKFHKELIQYYKENLIGGEHQILSKILPFWEYAEAEIGRKAWKAIKKSGNMAKYQTALALI